MTNETITRPRGSRLRVAQAIGIQAAVSRGMIFAPRPWPDPRRILEWVTETTMDISRWCGVPLPERIPLEGKYTRLEPLDPDRHGDELFEAVGGPSAEQLHRFLPDAVPASRADFEGWLTTKAASRDPSFYAVIDKASGRVEGRQSLMDINVDHGTAEIGHILWGPKIARSRVTTEAFFLLTDYMFGLGFRRWQWRCNASNTPSRQAAQRFGYRFEGIFRNHMVVKGASRDTAWYSIIDDAWPQLKSEYSSWLEFSNFDETGQQRRKLLASGLT